MSAEAGQEALKSQLLGCLPSNGEKKEVATVLGEINQVLAGSLAEILWKGTSGHGQRLQGVGVGNQHGQSSKCAASAPAASSSRSSSVSFLTCAAVRRMGASCMGLEAVESLYDKASMDEVTTLEGIEPLILYGWVLTAEQRASVAEWAKGVVGAPAVSAACAVGHAAASSSSSNSKKNSAAKKDAARRAAMDLFS